MSAEHRRLHAALSVPEADHRELDLVRPDEYLEQVVGWFRRHLAVPDEQGV